jgi:hypothetical protein
MATYVPGAQTYFPEFKPFTPDYKFLSGVLDVRTDRYNTNFKAINDAYGKVVYSDLSRNDTKEIRDQYANQLAPKLQQVSGMDLSIQQNADAANALFKPFYENNLIVKDIVVTDAFKKQLSYANGLLNSSDRKVRDQYWQPGIEALNYQLQDFVNASPEEALTLQTPKYVPDADLSEMAMDLLKKSELNVTKDITTGDWIITQKNGSIVTDAAYEYIRETLLDDPRVTNAYYTDGYVKQRKFVDDAMVKGTYSSPDEAKQAWSQSIIGDIASKLQEKINTQKKLLTQAETVKNNWENYAETSGILPGSDEEVRYNEAVTNYDALLKSQAFNEQLLKDYTQEPTDIKSYSNKAFNMLMSYNINDDMKAAARLYSMKNATLSVKANPYREIELKHLNDIELENLKLTNQKELKRYEKELEGAVIKEDQSLLDDINQRLGGAETTETELDPDADIVGINNTDAWKRLGESTDAKFDFIESLHQSVEAQKGEKGKPQMITYDTKDGEFTSSLETARKKLKEPGNEAYVSKLYQNYYTMFSKVKTDYPALANDDKAYLPIEAKREKAQELVYKSLNATKVENEIYYNNLKLAKNTKYGEFLKDYEKQGVPLYLATPYERALQEQQILKKQNPNADVSVLTPESGDNVKPSILTKQEYVNQFKQRALAGLIFNKDGSVITYKHKLTNNEYFVNREGPSPGDPFPTEDNIDKNKKDEYRIDEYRIEKDAIESYNAQKKLLNQTLNGALNVQATKEGLQTVEPFQPFSREQYYRGIPVEKMTVGNLSTYPVYSTFIAPNNIGKEQKEAVSSFFKQYNNTPTGYVYEGDLGKMEEVPKESNEKAKKLIEQVKIDLSAIITKPEAKKDSKLNFKIEYAPVYSSPKTPNKTTAAYIIKFDEDYIKSYNEGKADEDKITNNIVTFAFDQNVDMNPRNKSEYNFSYVQSVIQTSENKSFIYDLPDTGYINVYQNGNTWMYNMQTKTYDPKTGNYIVDVTTTPKPLVNSDGQIIGLNDLDRTVNGLKKALNDLYTYNNNAKKLNKQQKNNK